MCPHNLNPCKSVTYRNKVDASNQNDVTSVDANVTEAEEKIWEREKMVRSEKKPENLSRIKLRQSLKILK